MVVHFPETHTQGTNKKVKSLVITIDKIDVDEMLKHRALKSEKGANFCGNHRTDCIIQQLDQNKTILLYLYFLRLWSIVCA